MPEKPPAVAIAATTDGGGRGDIKDADAEDEGELRAPLDDVRQRNPSVHLCRPTNYIADILRETSGADSTSVDINQTAMEAISARVNTGNEMGLFGYLEGSCLTFMSSEDLQWSYLNAFLTPRH